MDGAAIQEAIIMEQRFPLKTLASTGKTLVRAKLDVITTRKLSSL
jgi:hypothetical protein